MAVDLVEPFPGLLECPLGLGDILGRILLVVEFTEAQGEIHRLDEDLDIGAQR
jgi:hypothetical protein